MSGISLVYVDTASEVAFIAFATFLSRFLNYIGCTPTAYAPHRNCSVCIAVQWWSTHRGRVQFDNPATLLRVAHRFE